MKKHIEFHSVLPQHSEIHRRLSNWARWARPPMHSAKVSPMFQYFRRTNVEKLDEADPAPARMPEIDILDAEAMERKIVNLRPTHRKAIIWWYCWRGSPIKIKRTLRVGYGDLRIVLDEARSMLDSSNNFFAKN